MPRKKHKTKEIEATLRLAEANGWKVEQAGKSAHCWARLYCPYEGLNEKCRCGNFCIVSVWGTPRNPLAHAENIRRAVENCILFGGSK
jgi:hypothetical protein